MAELRERLYELLPRLYRQRDEAHGQPLRALMAVLDAEFSTLEADMVALYDNWFIETCDDWVLPYLAQLVDAGPLGDGVRWHYTERRRVANTIAYRRRQGTIATLENVIFDATGWRAKVVETNLSIAATQHVSDVRLQRGRSVDVRDRLAISRLHGPFTSSARSVEIPPRSTSPEIHWPQTGRKMRQYRPEGATIYLWRLQPVLMESVTPCPIPTDDGDEQRPAGTCFTFDPVGRSQALFKVPEPLRSIDEVVRPENVPMPLSREAFAADLADEQRYREVEDANESVATRLGIYGPGRSLHLVIDGKPVSSNRIVSGNLRHWPDKDQISLWRKGYSKSAVIVDVQLGRFVLLDPSTRQPPDLLVDYAYAFSDDIAGGSYGRGVRFSNQVDLVWNVRRPAATLSPQPGEPDRSGADTQAVDKLDVAIQQWNESARNFAARRAVSTTSDTKHADRLVGSIRLLDNATHTVSEPCIEMPPGSELTIIAADQTRAAVRLTAPLVINTSCSEPHDDRTDRHRRDVHPPTRLELNGLLIDGVIRIEAVDEEADGHAGVLDFAIEHCTLLPVMDRESICAHSGLGRLQIQDSIVGQLNLSGSVQLTVSQSVVDGGWHGSATAIRGTNPGKPVAVELTRSTVFGAMSHIDLGLAENVLFTRPLERPAPGPLRFCYVPRDERDANALRRAFTSVRCGDAAYAQLGSHCPETIHHAGQDGSQPGVFHRRYRPQRLSGLQRMVNEYAPLGLEWMIEYVT